MGFELGRTYSAYEFLDVLRTSRSTAAYRVRNRLARREEQLQVLLESAQDDQEQVERFMREIAVRASLAHPNIVMFYTACVLEGRLVMTTELVEGPTLAERLEAGPLAWREAVAIARQALSALACAHARNVVHRDISPQNIVLAGDVAKLVNFALAKSVSSPQLTLAGAIVGNPRYISPEQVRGTGELDARSDIYSLGAVLYEMLCGAPPFDSRSQFEMMLAHVNGAVKPPSEIDANAPSGLDAVVLKALAKRPSDRYQTAEEFMEALPPPAPVIAMPRQLLLAPPAEPPEPPVQNGAGQRQPAPVLEPAAEPQALAPPAELAWAWQANPAPAPAITGEPHTEAVAPQPAFVPLPGAAGPARPEETAQSQPETASALAPEPMREAHTEPAETQPASAPLPEPSSALPTAVTGAEPQPAIAPLPEPSFPLPAAVTAESQTEPAEPQPAFAPLPEPSSPLPAAVTAESHTEPAEPPLTLAPPAELAWPGQPEAVTAESQTEPAEPQPAFAPLPDAAWPWQPEATAQSQLEPASALAPALTAEPHADAPRLEPAFPWQPQSALAPPRELPAEPHTQPSEPQIALAPPPESAFPWQPEPAFAPLPETPAVPQPAARSTIPARDRNGASLAPPPSADEPLVPPSRPSPPLGLAIIGGAAAGAAAVFLAIWFFT